MNDQAQALRDRMKRKRSTKTKVAAVLSGKGGVGKSVFSINFSISLARRGKRVLLIDLDIGMGNVDVLMGIRAPYTITEMIDQRLPIRDIIVHHNSGASFITGGSGLSQLFHLTPSKTAYFLDQLKQLKQDFDVIIFDLGAGVNQDLIRFVQSSHEVILVTTPEPTSLTDAYSVIKAVAVHNPKLPIRCIMNRSDTTKEVQEAWQKLSGVSERFINKKLEWLGSLPRDRAVIQAVKWQQPFVLTQPKARISACITQLVDVYLDADKKDEETSYDTFIFKVKNLFRLKG